MKSLEECSKKYPDIYSVPKDECRGCGLLDEVCQWGKDNLKRRDQNEERHVPGL